MIDRPTLYLIPALGADERMYRSLACSTCELVCLTDPPADADETLESYSQKYAAQINAGQCVLVGGSSFGAMIAVQVARHVHAKAAFVIGGFSSNRQIPVHLRGVAQLIGWMPAVLLQKVDLMWPLLSEKFGSLPDEQARLFIDMFKKQSQENLKHKLRLLLDAALPGMPACPVFQIHGRSDRLVPLGKVKPDAIIDDAEHLIAMSHPVDVSEFIDRCVRSLLTCQDARP